MALLAPTPSNRRAMWLAEARAVAVLSAPLALTNVMQIGMGTTDVVLMGRLGPDALAAGALGTNLYFVALIVGLGLLNAVAPLVAQARGRDRGDVTDVRRTVQQGFWAAALVAVPAWTALWWCERILLWMGQAPDLAALAGTYVRVLQWAMLPFLAYQVLRAFTGALERPAWSLAIGAAALLVNAAGNWCLMLGHCGVRSFGIAGSGMATLIASVLMFSALAVVVRLDREFRAYRLFDAWWHLDLQRLRALLHLGLPMAATLAFEVTIFNAAVFLMGLIGAAELAAHAIAIQLAVLSFMLPLGIGQAAAIRVGLAAGAGDLGAIRRAGWSAFGLGFLCTATASLIFVTFPHALIGLFVDAQVAKNAPVIALASTYLAVAALFQIADGTQAVGSGVLRGLKDARVPMLNALFGYWGIGLPLGILLAFPGKWGGLGLWIGLATGLGVVACLMIQRWTRREALGLVGSGVIKT